jgi:hypothetical protein
MSSAYYPSSFLGEIPRQVLGPFRGPRDTLAKMGEHALGRYGEQSALVLAFTHFVVQYVTPKDYLSELLAVRSAFVQPSPRDPNQPMFRYVSDPTHTETLKTPERLVREIQAQGFTIGDCDDSSTLAATMGLILGREVELVAMGFAPGSLSHVGVRIREPKSKRWVWLDGVAGPREKEAAGRAKELLVWSLH